MLKLCVGIRCRLWVLALAICVGIGCVTVGCGSLALVLGVGCGSWLLGVGIGSGSWLWVLVLEIGGGCDHRCWHWVCHCGVWGFW